MPRGIGYNSEADKILAEKKAKASGTFAFKKKKDKIRKQLLKPLIK